MEKSIRIIPYFRTSKPSAVIYVRGYNEELQEMVCRIYAIDQRYEVLYTTRNLEDVTECDYLLVTSPSRISRNQHKYHESMNKLKSKGITVISVTSQDNVDESISFAIDLFKSNKNKLKQKAE